MNPITFQTGMHTRITLSMPEALINMPLKNIRKILKWAEPWGNEDATAEFFSRIPEVKQELWNTWNMESIRFQREYRDPRNGKDKLERDKIRYKNARLKSLLTAAKAEHDRFEKKIPKLMELNEQEEK